MPRTKLELPAHFSFTTDVPVRITDINYGGHVGNDSMLSIIHEARVRFLLHYGYEEMNFAGVGLIMTDVTIEFKNELFYGDVLRASICASDFSRVTFDLHYKLEKRSGDRWITVSLARTGMACYDYKLKKLTTVPKEVCTRLLT